MLKALTRVLVAGATLPVTPVGLDPQMNALMAVYMFCVEQKHADALKNNEAHIQAVEYAIQECKPLIVKIRNNYGDTIAITTALEARARLTFNLAPK